MRESYSMRVGSKHYKSIWLDESDPSAVKAIDQKKLPFFFEVLELRSVDDIYNAISDMSVRGAPAIGAAGAFGIYLAANDITPATNIRHHLENAVRYLVSCRPTAVNLSWAVSRVMKEIEGMTGLQEISTRAREAALEICRIEEENCRQIGIHGLEIIEALSRQKEYKPVNILTHCNAGWLACIDYGTVTSPIYAAHEKGIPLHVWVDETRPLNQGARLTAWELGEAGVSHTLITDNAGGHIMQNGMVDLVLVGSDRTTSQGDVANKIGTYLKALAAHDNNIPFYSLFTSSSLDAGITDGLSEIAVEERDQEEVTTVRGLLEDRIETVRICSTNTPAANYGFDITPAKYITGLITEKGICRPSKEDIRKMFSEKFS